MDEVLQQVGSWDCAGKQVPLWHRRLRGEGQFRAGTISWEIFVFKEGDEIFPWRILGLSAAQ